MPTHTNKVTLRFVVPNDEAEQWQSLIDEFETTQIDKFETAHLKIEIDLVNLRDQDAIKPQDPRAVKKNISIRSIRKTLPTLDFRGYYLGS